MAAPDDLPQWADYLDLMKGAEAVIDLLPEPNDVQSRQAAYRLFFHSLAAGYMTAFAEPDLPDFVPMVNNVFNSQGANPDFIYGSARIDGTGSYRLTGNRGGGIFLLFDFLAGGIGVMDELGPSVGALDAEDLQIGKDGGFDVLLSSERPRGYRGDWFRLDPRATAVSVRQASYAWGEAAEARIAIDRIDRPIVGANLDAAETANRLTKLAAYAHRYSKFALEYCKGLRERGLINKLEHDDWSGRGGVAGQHYYQGLFHLQPGHALILETELPERVRYWAVQVNDPLWNTVDWLNHQCSINGGHASVDPDGKFRAVISADDPAVPNWLDTAGNTDGSIMLRWTGASSAPKPSCVLVPMANIRAQLPVTTGTVTFEMRQESLRRRRRGAQLRRRW
jgi:hypothetical protein